MTGLPIQWAANISCLFSEEPASNRPAAAAAAGFEAIESWWPFGSTPEPSPAAVDTFVGSVQRAGIRLVAMNLFGGSPGLRGILAQSEFTPDFRASLTTTTTVAPRLGVMLANAPIGDIPADAEPSRYRDTAVDNLAFAAGRLADVGVCVMVEPLSPKEPNGSVPLIRTMADALDITRQARERGGCTNIGVLLDFYHMTFNADDPIAAVLGHHADIRHVQVADIPGRDVPGTGTANIGAFLHALQGVGYDGFVALECFPRESTQHSLASWRPRECP